MTGENSDGDHRDKLKPETRVVGARRHWSAALKRQILDESYHPDAVISAVARKYELSIQQLFHWRRLEKKRSGVPDQSEAGSIKAKASHSRLKKSPEILDPGILEMEVEGVIIRVSSSTDPGLLLSVVRALRSQS